MTPELRPLPAVCTGEKALRVNMLCLCRNLHDLPRARLGLGVGEGNAPEAWGSRARV